MSKYKFYYVVHSGFFTHLHIYQTMMSGLHKAGIDAQIICFVSRALYISKRSRYFSAFPCVITLCYPKKRFKALYETIYFAWKLLTHNVVIQILRTSEPNIKFLRKFARLFNHRFIFLYQMEGDAYAERLYLEQHIYMPGFYDQTLVSYNKETQLQLKLATLADGLVLRSMNHIQLWSSRLAFPFNSVAIPDLFNPAVYFFRNNSREITRSKLGISDSTVLIYTGNVLVSWQRFGSVCRLLKGMQRSGLKVKLVALVREADHPIAKFFMMKYAVSDSTILKYVPSNEVPIYLSAADIGIFLRADHLMNRIVTSAKLGEYLACGLPVLTTGVGAVYPAYILESEAGFFLNDLDEWNASNNDEFLELVNKGQNEQWRKCFSQKTITKFCEDSSYSVNYRNFIKNFMRPSPDTVI